MRYLRIKKSEEKEKHTESSSIVSNSVSIAAASVTQHYHEDSETESSRKIDDLVSLQPSDFIDREKEYYEMVTQPDNEETESETKNPRVSFTAMTSLPKKMRKRTFPPKLMITMTMMTRQFLVQLCRQPQRQ